MNKFLTAYDIANNVRMTRTLHIGSILIVEGNTDLRIYERFVDKINCTLLPGYGKPNTIGAIGILEKAGLKGIIAIVDSDFWILENIAPSSANILQTDYHDLDTMIIASNALEKVILEFGSSAKIKKIGKSIRDLLLGTALPIGLLRWISSPSKDNLFLKFKGISYYNFIDKVNLSVNIDNLIKEVNDNSSHVVLDVNSIKNKIIQMMNKPIYDPWQVCNGHDLAFILFIGLKHIFGNRRSNGITPEAMDAILRLSYELSHFLLSKLYSSIKKWEKANQSFKVL